MRGNRDNQLANTKPLIKNDIFTATRLRNKVGEIVAFKIVRGLREDHGKL